MVDRRKSNMSGMELLVSDRHGVYIPQIFAGKFSGGDWHIAESNSDWLSILTGPDANEGYWDAWDAVLGRASYTDSNGFVWTLHQDGDLWAVCPELMTEEEYEGYFGEARQEIA
jgi:hypothetical protein